MAILILTDKVDFKSKANKEGNYILIKASIQWEDKTIVNKYAPNSRVPNIWIKH